MQRVAREHTEFGQAVFAGSHRARAAHLAAGSRCAGVHDLRGGQVRMGMELVAGQAALEHLFWVVRISSAKGTSQFERRYAAPERVLPQAVAAQSISPDLRPSDQEAFRQLMLISAKAHGVGTEQDLRDYFRLKPEMARPAARSPGRGRGPHPGERRRMEATGIPAQGRAHPAHSARRGAPEPLRLPDLAARPDSRVVRLPLPARDLRPRPPADPRLLRAALPVWRRSRRPGRPQGRSRGKHVAGASDPLGAGRAAGGQTSPRRHLADMASWLGLGAVAG